jgi:hypothetical protein
MTTMTSIRQLNANGVALLRDHGMYRGAAGFFRQAVECLARLIKDDGGGRGSVETKDRNCNTNAVVADAGSSVQQQHAELYLDAVPVHAKITSFELSFSPGNCFAFYGRTFLVQASSSTEEQECCDETCQLQLTAVLLYNWALSCHYAAINIGKSKYLNRAMQLYTKAYHVLTDHHHNDSSDMMVFNTSTTLLLLAINNNMGHISAHLADEVAARNFQDNLKFILSLDCCSAAADSSSSATRLEYEFFFSTILLLVDDPCQPILSRASAA